MKILVTGSKGFIGTNLCAWLGRYPEFRVMRFDTGQSVQDLFDAAQASDVIFHLAGVNRPLQERDFDKGNVDLTALVCDAALAQSRPPLLVLSSSTQATLDNPYGRSKRKAEDLVETYCSRTGGRAVIYRLPNVFGKWCRPNYNSAIATFCHNTAHGLPLTVSDPCRELDIVYVDDVVRTWLDLLNGRGGGLYPTIEPVYRLTLGSLVEAITSFKAIRESARIPAMDDLTRKLYATYLSCLPLEAFGYSLQPQDDTRGRLAEFLRFATGGQIFVSRTRPGVTRGNHYHHTKTEKFLVLEGHAVIRLRHLLGGGVLEYPVNGAEMRVIDIPPGYTHSIENIGPADLVTLFWASEIFDPSTPDTHALEVLPKSPTTIGTPTTWQ